MAIIDQVRHNGDHGLEGHRVMVRKGFTIIELLIVIVVIGILAALVISTFVDAQARARASSVATNLRAVEKALLLLASDEGRTSWWLDTELTGGGNPHISTLVANTNLKKYLQSFSLGVGEGTYWIYDNDGDAQPNCSPGVINGVNIYAYGVDAKIAQYVDEQLDDGNINCGPVTYANNNLRYALSGSQLIE